MNQVINSNRYSRYSGGDMKRAWTARTASSIKKQFIGQTLDDGPYWFNFVWYRKDKRTDPDNIASTGMKFIFDGFQLAKVLKNDGWQQVKGFNHEFRIDKEKPRVEINITKITKE